VIVERMGTGSVPVALDLLRIDAVVARKLPDEGS
jgi:hypothetical protein